MAPASWTTHEDTYHRRYPLPELCRAGRLDGCDMVAVSSGSPGQAGSAEREAQLADAIRAELRRLNSEFAHYVPETAQLPVVELRQAGDAEFFPPGVKHRYTRPSARPLS